LTSLKIKATIHHPTSYLLRYL